MADEKIIYTMSRVSKGFEKKPLLKDISLSYFYGAKICVLGVNGSGKSTLLKIMAGLDKNFDGEISIVPGYSIGYLEQEPKLDPEKTVKECIEEGVAGTKKLLEDYDETFVQLGEIDDKAEQEKILQKQGEIQEKLDLLDAWDLDSKIEMAMNALRCPDENALSGTLSGGEKRRVALCRLLLKSPDILLLDEPTNHLDAETIDWLERFLHQYKGTVIAITHDRYFLDNVAGWILEIDRGYGIPWKGNYSSWLEQKEKRLAAEEKVASARQKTMARERQWAATSPSGRLAKNKARLRAYEAMLLQDEREQEKVMEIFVPAGPRLGEKVIVAKNLSKAYSDKLLLDKVNFTIPAGGIVGIIGANGAGKTTLFKMIVGEEKPDSGEIILGETVKFAYVNQSRDVLDNSKMLWEVISDGNEIVELGKVKIPARQYAARFGFTGAEQQKMVGLLSGGERNRVHLARILKSGANLLLLDEPTNDLDVNTIRALEDALNGFAGCAIVITHDRWFLDRVATHILAFEGDSKIYFHEGNYSSYEADRRKRLGNDSETPRRIKFRQFFR